jgi:hypothetical protein
MTVISTPRMGLFCPRTSGPARTAADHLTGQQRASRTADTNGKISGPPALLCYVACIPIWKCWLYSSKASVVGVPGGLHLCRHSPERERLSSSSVPRLVVTLNGRLPYLYRSQPAPALCYERSGSGAIVPSTDSTSNDPVDESSAKTRTCTSAIIFQAARIIRYTSHGSPPPVLLRAVPPRAGAASAEDLYRIGGDDRTAKLSAPPAFPELEPDTPTKPQ